MKKEERKKEKTSRGGAEDAEGKKRFCFFSAISASLRDEILHSCLSPLRYPLLFRPSGTVFYPYIRPYSAICI